MKMIVRGLIFSALLVTHNASVAQAQTWPQQPIKMIVPFAAGSATDMVGRLLSDHLSKALKQPIFVDNKPGANTTLGINMVAKADPDGYTLALGSNPGLVSSPAGLTAHTPYDPVKDLKYVSLVGAIPFVWIANKDLPPKNAKEMIDYIKANPGKVNYGSGNTGGIAYGGYIKNHYGLDSTHVPYKSTPQAVVDLLAGRVGVIMIDIATAAPLVKSGQVKALGMPIPERNPVLPEVPTFLEQGLETPPDMSGWWAVVAPAATPDAIMDKLNTEVVQILKKPEVRETLLNRGIVVTPSTRKEATEYQREQLEVWKKLIKDLGLKPE